MEDAIAAARVLVALGWYIGVYVLPLAVVTSAVIRLITMRNSNIKATLAAALAAGPLTANAVLGLGLSMAWVLAGLVATVLAVALLWRGSRGFRSGYMMIEAFSLFGALAYIISGVTWIVG